MCVCVCVCVCVFVRVMVGDGYWGMLEEKLLNGEKDVRRVNLYENILRFYIILLL